MNFIGRCYSGEDRRWRWQPLSASRDVIEESQAAHKDYKTCVANARDQDYVFHPAQAKLAKASLR